MLNRVNRRVNAINPAALVNTLGVRSFVTFYSIFCVFIILSVQQNLVFICTVAAYERNKR